MLNKNQENEIRDWWDSAADYYQKEISGDKMDDVHYGPFASSESKLKLLGNVKNKKVLEVGCGAGQVSIALAKKGAVCTGIDISPKQIDKAVINASKQGVSVNFLNIPFSSLHKLKQGSFDIIISVMSFQYCEDLNYLFREVNRILKKNGVLIFSVEHPFYLLIDPNDLKIKESYFNTGLKRKKEVWPDKSIHFFSYYDRKISDFTNSLVSAKLKIEKIIEPFEKKDLIWGEGYRRALVNRIGPTIIFKCIKESIRPNKN